MLVDKRAPGEESSFGNAGLIQKEAAEPYAFPKGVGFLLKAALGLGAEVNWHAQGLLQMSNPLLKYFKHSQGQLYAKISLAYSQLIQHATQEHAPFIEAAGAESLITREGFRYVYRTPKAFEAGISRAQRLEKEFGVPHRTENRSELSRAEPSLLRAVIGAIHWLEPWSVSNPGGLVKKYADLFIQRGGQIVLGDGESLQQTAIGWSMNTSIGHVDASQTVLAIGPWAGRFMGKLGYRWPLFIKRGYHQHYISGGPLRLPVLDAEKGYVLAPMQRGLRLTTGAEFAPIDASPTPVQLTKAEPMARELLDLGQSLAEPVWVGARPCTADMLPVMGPAPKHKGLWFNFGHGHQGFTLGPVAGRLLAEMIDTQPTFIDAVPYLPERF